MPEKRTKTHSVKCELLESTLQTLINFKSELLKRKTDMEAVQAIQKCTVSLSDNIEVSLLVDVSNEVKEIIDSIIPNLVQHAEKHPAAEADRDSGIDIPEEGEVAMAERPFVLNSIETGTRGESRC